MNHIKGLDGLRAVAFLLVFFFHAHFGYFGWVGVQLFFVLSGFLITGILLDMKQILPTAEYFVKFYGRRFLRIFPLYYLYLFLIALVAAYLLGQKIRSPYMLLFWEQFPYALGYVYNFFMATSKFVQTSQFLTHLWSLAVEEQFYIVWPLVIFLTPTRHLKKVFLASIGLAAFAFGALITIGISLSKAKGQFLFLLAALPALGMLTDYLTMGQWNANNGFGLPLLLSNAYKPVWGYLILNYLFMLLIYGVVREDWLTRPLEHPWMRYLGKISYGLYVYHYAILWTITDLKDRWFTFKPADKSAQNL